MNDAITPFRIDFSEAAIDDLRERLRRTQWPEPGTVVSWSQGTPVRSPASDAFHVVCPTLPASGSAGSPPSIEFAVASGYLAIQSTRPQSIGTE